MSRSVLQDRDRRECYLCALGWGEGFGPLEEHHIFYGSHHARKSSEHYGLKVLLCIGHHREGKKAVHKNPETRAFLCRIAQEAFEKRYGHEKHMEIFGWNYLEPVATSQQKGTTAAGGDGFRIVDGEGG